MPRASPDDRGAAWGLPRDDRGWEREHTDGVLEHSRWIVRENPWKLAELCYETVAERCYLLPPETLLLRAAVRIAEDLPELKGDRPSRPWLEERVREEIECVRTRMQEDVRTGVVPVEEHELEHYSTLIDYGIEPVSAFKGITSFDGQAEIVRRTWYAICMHNKSLSELDEEVFGPLEEVRENLQTAFKALFGLLPIDGAPPPKAEDGES